jgi:hypothetical protein
MSVQLILYPQRPIPGNANEFVVNGINFTNLSSASTYSSSVATTTTGLPTALVQNVLTNASPAFLNFLVQIYKHSISNSCCTYLCFK